MTLIHPVLALFTSMLCIFVLYYFASSLGLLDKPCERKQHKGSVPLVGGMSIFFAVATTLIFTYEVTQSLSLYLIASGLIVFIGVLDDKYDLSVRSRLIAQTLITAILIFGLDLYISQLGNVFFYGDVSLGGFGKVFTVVAIIAAINAFNMIDGIDGLLGGTGVVAFTSICILSLLAGNEFIFTISLVIISALMPYLFANLAIFPFNKAKVFMGDAGSMFIGLSVIWFVVYSIQSTDFGDAAFRPVFALYAMAIPLMDMVAIMYRRVKKGKSPFTPDREHIHHIFMRAGFSARQAMAILVCISSLIAAMGVLLEVYMVQEYLMLILFLFIFAAYSYAIQHSFKITKFCRKYLKIKNA